MGEALTVGLLQTARREGVTEAVRAAVAGHVRHLEALGGAR